MILAKLSTAKTLSFGQVLDSNGAEYTGAVVGDVKICKNNGTPAALNGSATLTHKEVGMYELVLTASDLSEVGVITVQLSKTTYVAAPVRINVLPALVYDSLVGGTDALQVDLLQILGTSLTETSAGYLAAAFKKLFDVATPVFTAASVNQTGDSYADVHTNGVKLPVGTGAGQIALSSGAVTVGTNNDKTGYTASTVSDKTGYSLSTTPPTAAQVATAVWQDSTAGDFTAASSIGKSLYTSGNAPGAASGLAIVGSAMGLANGSIITATFGTCVPPAPSGMSTLTQTQVTGGAYDVTNASCGIHVSVGTGAGQINVSSGVVPASGNWNTTTPPSASTIAGAVLDEAKGAHTGLLAGVALDSTVATAANQTTILNRLGAFTGTGWNTILGFLRALLRKDVGVTLPSDIGGTFDNTTDSIEAIRDTAPMGTAMRGTDSAALASVCTETRLAQLDSAALPTSVSGIKTITDRIATQQEQVS